MVVQGKGDIGLGVWEMERDEGMDVWIYVSVYVWIKACMYV